MASVLDWSWTLVLISILITRYAAIDIPLETTNQSQTYNYTFSRADRTSADVTDTLTIISPDRKVQLTVSSSGNLSDQACNEGPVQVFTGQSRLVVGSYCGSKGEEYFAGSHTVLAIVINTTSLPDDIEFSFQYSHDEIYSAMTSSWTPRFVYTSNYPNGGSLFNISHLFIRVPDEVSERSFRLLATLKYADVDYTSNCSISFVGLIMNHNKKSSIDYVTKTYRWCGNETNTFAASKDSSALIAVGQKLLESGMQIMLKTIEVPACERDLLFAGTDPVVIQSPNFPNSYPALQACRTGLISADKPSFWYFLVKVDVIDVDCTNDAIDLMYTDRSYNGRLIALECKEAPYEVEVYTQNIRVWFISGVQNSLNQTGYNMTVLRLNDTSCFTELEATDSEQKLLPPLAVPRHGVCKWVITAAESVKVVYLRIKNWQSFSCGDPTNVIYDGLTETSSSMLNRNCPNQGFYQTTGPKMLIVVSKMADIQNSTQQIEYWQGQYLKNLTSNSGNISYPFEAGNYKQGADVTWTITVLQGRRMALMFSKMDVNCEGDAVNIRDGEQVRSICGSQDRRILSQTNNVQINFKSTTDKGRGFQLEYSDLIDKECSESVLDVNMNDCNVASPGSDYYYDFLLCKWRITAEKEKIIKLTINVTEITSNSQEECKGDYLQVYDGNSEKSSPLQRVCGTDKAVMLESSGNEMYLEFVTDSELSGSGFKAQCQTMPKAVPDSGLSAGAIVGIVLAVLAVLVLGVLLYLYIKRRQSDKSMAEITAVNENGTQMSSSPPYYNMEKNL